MNSDPAYKYNIFTFSDKTLDYRNNVSYYLKKHVLYIENIFERFEIFIDSKFREEEVFMEEEIFIIRKVKKPINLDNEKMNTLKVFEFIIGSLTRILSRKYIVKSQVGRVYLVRQRTYC